MSAFNRLHFVWVSDVGAKLDVVAQFRFGRTWQLEYRVGDVLVWNGNNVGPRHARHVIVPGWVEDTAGGKVPQQVAIHVIDGTLACVRILDRAIPLNDDDEEYLIVEP